MTTKNHEPLLDKMFDELNDFLLSLQKKRDREFELINNNMMDEVDLYISKNHSKLH
jgi:hypothetical protein